MSASSPLIDYTLIRFPSDQLTIGHLRRAFPYCFDLRMYRDRDVAGTLNEHPYGRASIDSELGHLIDSERRIAAIAYKEVLGQSREWDEQGTFSEMTNSLSLFYEELQLASGRHHSKQLVRDIVNQAKAQAKAHITTRSR